MAKDKTGGRRASGGGGVNPADILGTHNFLIDPKVQKEVRDELGKVLKNFQSEYGIDYNNTRIAQLKPRARALAFYDGSGIAFNSKYVDKAKMDKVMQESAKSGFHPPLGRKTGLQAVASHELGHALSDEVAKKMGTNLRDASTRIVKEAVKQTSHKGVVQMARKISTYATSSNAEAVAEAVADVYCNGRRAKAESKAIMSVLKKYLK